MANAPYLKGFVERVEVGDVFLYLQGWVAKQDNSRLQEPVNVKIPGHGDGVINKLTFRRDLADAGIAEGWAAFFAAIPLVGVDKEPVVHLALSDGESTQFTSGETVYESFRPKGCFDREAGGDVVGWVFDPGLTGRNTQAQLLLEGRTATQLVLDQPREDLPFWLSTSPDFGFRLPAEEIGRMLTEAGIESGVLTLVTSGVELDRMTVSKPARFAKEVTDKVKLRVESYTTYQHGMLLRGWVCHDDMSPITTPLTFRIGDESVQVDQLYNRTDLLKAGVGGGYAAYSIFFTGVLPEPALVDVICESSDRTAAVSLSTAKEVAQKAEGKISRNGDEFIVHLYDPENVDGTIGIFVDGTRVGSLQLEPPANDRMIWSANGLLPSSARFRLEWLKSRYRSVIRRALLTPMREYTVTASTASGVSVEIGAVLAKQHKGNLERHDERGVHGWLKPVEGRQMADYEILINGVPFRKGSANVSRRDLQDKGVAKHGGSFVVPVINPTAGASIEISMRPAYQDELIGRGLEVSNVARSAPRLESAYSVLSMSKGAGISIVMPIYNAADDVRKCLASIKRHTPTAVQVILIDDCSPDPSIQKILLEYVAQKNWTILKNELNLGFTKTVNRGILKAGNDDVIFLNSDTIVTPGWIQGLRVAAYSGARIATATPFSNNAGVFSVPEMNEDNESPEGCSLDDLSRIVRHTSMATYPRVPTGNGFCMYVRRDCLDDIGLLDDSAFPVGYGEENDFCMRALHRGYEHVIDDRTLIYHKRSASFGSKKSAHYDSGQETLKRRYPEYASLTSVFSEAPDILAARWRVRSALAGGAQTALPRVLFVIATTTGGTPQTNADLMLALKNRYEGWILQCDSRTIRLYREQVSDDTLVWQKLLPAPIDPRVHRSEEYNAAVFEILVRFGFELLHIRHLGWHGLDLPGLGKILQIPVVLSFHDFYSVCPTIKLLDERGTFCGGDCTDTEGDCSVELWKPSQFPQLKHSFVHRWSHMFASVIRDCDAFITTSNFAKDILVKKYERLRDSDFRVIPHGRDFVGFHSIAQDVSSRPLKILVPGNISRAKGAALIQDLNRLDRGENLEFHILGDHGRLVAGPGLVVHGGYVRSEFGDRARRIGPSIGAVLSMWPETYCHTLTELWSMGVPVVGFDIGAVGERIAEHGGGWLMDVSKSVDDILAFLLRIASDREGARQRVTEVLEWQAGYGRSYGTSKMAAEYDAIYRQLIFGPEI